MNVEIRPCGAAGSTITFEVARIQDRHRVVHGGGDAVATGHFIVDKIVEVDHYLLPASERESVSPRTECHDDTIVQPCAGPCDAFTVFEDQYLLGNVERPPFLQLKYLHQTFSVEVIESILMNYRELFCKAGVFSSSFHRRPRFCCHVHNTRNSYSYYNATSPHFFPKYIPNAPLPLSRPAELTSSFFLTSTILHRTRDRG